MNSECNCVSYTGTKRERRFWKTFHDAVRDLDPQILPEMLEEYPRAPEHRLYGAVFDHRDFVDSIGFDWRSDGLYDTLKILFENNYAGRIDVNKSDDNGYALIHYISRSRDPRFVDLLVKHGARVNGVGLESANPSPVSFAIARGSMSMIRRLLFYDVQINDLDYHSPLWQIWRFAVGFDADDLLRLCALLISLGADIDNVTGCLGRTPIDEMLEYRGDPSAQIRAFDRLQLLRAAGIQITMTLPPPRWDNDVSLFVLDDPDEQAKYRRMIRRAGFELICERATEICIALQSFRLPAAVTLEIIDADIPVAYRIAHWFKWQIATKVKHFIPRQE